MFKTLLALTMLTAMTLPAWAGSEHDHGHGTHDHTEHAEEAQLVITPITPDVLQAGQENKVALFVQDTAAKPVDISKFEVVHTQPVHLLIIDPALKDYHHEHPVQMATGQYWFNFIPQTACSYRIWVDVQLKGASQQYVPVDLKGEKDCTVPAAQEVKLEASSQGYDFKLTLDGDLKKGEGAFANMSISKNNKLIDHLEPVMGAFAHMVGFYDDYQTIAHIHPMGKEPVSNAERGGPTLRFHIEPTQTGYLKLFAQVQINQKQIFAPFTVKVSE